MTTGQSPRLVHVTTADISLELLLGPQLSAFADAGYEVIGMSADGPFVQAIVDRGVEHIPLANATRSMAPHRDIAAVWELYRLFRRLKPDIVHTHNPKPGLYGRLAAKAAGVPVILNTVHGLYAQPDDPLIKRTVVYSLERIAAACSHVELVQSVEDLYTLDTIMRVPTKKLRLLGNGIDLERFKPDPSGATRASIRDALGIDYNAIVIGAVGRLVEMKGYPELFEAWERVRVDHPNALLMVIGPTDKDKSDSLSRNMIRAAEEAGVRFLGMREDMEDLYPSLDIYVLASHREGFPRSAMEAAACGIPVVATDIRGCRQVVDVGVTGELVPVSSPGALASTLSGLIADASRRKRMATASIQRARDHFDQQDVIEMTLDAYGTLLKRSISAKRRTANPRRMTTGSRASCVTTR